MGVWPAPRALSTCFSVLQFLIDKNGCVVKRYGPMEEPQVSTFVQTLRQGCVQVLRGKSERVVFLQVIEKDLPCYL